MFRRSIFLTCLSNNHIVDDLLDLITCELFHSYPLLPRPPSILFESSDNFDSILSLVFSCWRPHEINFRHFDQILVIDISVSLFNFQSIRLLQNLLSDIRSNLPPSSQFMLVEFEILAIPLISDLVYWVGIENERVMLGATSSHLL